MSYEKDKQRPFSFKDGVICKDCKRFFQLQYSFGTTVFPNRNFSIFEAECAWCGHKATYNRNELIPTVDKQQANEQLKNENEKLRKENENLRRDNKRLTDILNSIYKKDDGKNPVVV